MKKRIAVIGAGNGGFAMAADLTLSGYEVSLFELPRYETNVVDVREKGGVKYPVTVLHKLVLQS